MIAAAVALLLTSVDRPTDWRRVATADDRTRLRRWRDDWQQVLSAARGGTDGAAIAADPVLFDPDTSLDDPLPPLGGYRCRIVRFAGRRLLAGGWSRCSVPARGDVRGLAAEDEPRFDGTLYPDATRRGIFLGTRAYPGERHPARYGHAAGRDMVGIVERIAPQRWRITLPWPRYESELDVVELVPAG